MNFTQSIRYLERTLERDGDPIKRGQIRNVIRGMIIKMEAM